jgi:long-chain acyl-CoA synthetase
VGTGDGGWSVAGLVRRHGQDRPDAPALTFGPTTSTWAELDERSSRLAQGLAASGVKAGDHVAFLDKNCPEYFEFLFGCGKINAVGVAVNWRLAASEMQYILNDAEAKVLVIGAGFLAHLEEMQPGLKTVEEVIVIGEAAPTGVAYRDWLAAQRPEDPGVVASGGDVALQLYTSGTTGLPKGAMLTNHNFTALLGDIQNAWRLDELSVNAVAMPLFHIGGSGWALAGMSVGCHTAVFRELVPDELLADFERLRVTNAFLVPAMLQMLSSVAGEDQRDYSALRSIVYGASPITDDVLVRSMRTFGCDFVQVYGLTETTGAITQLDAVDHDVAGPRASLLRSAGRPYPWVQLRIVDPDSGADRAVDEVGELWTRSSQNMLGYWNKPEATAAAITADGWFRTGDAGFVDAEGYLFLTDRIKDMIVSGGENVYPAEVENVLAGHPAVDDVAVIGVPDDRWGETVMAVVVLRRELSAAPEELIAHCRQRLAHYKCPTTVVFAETLPRNPSGKILKRELREPYWEGRARRVN